MIVSLFFIICGICFSYSKNNLKRACNLALIAIIITIGSVVLTKTIRGNYYIFFGIIHCYSACIFIFYFVEKIKRKDTKIFIYILFLIVSFIILILNPTLKATNALMFLGIPIQNHFYAFDYFPIFPYIGVFTIGLIVGKEYKIEFEKTNIFFDRKILYPLIFIGKRGKAIYILHFPVLVLFIIILGIIFN